MRPLVASARPWATIRDVLLMVAALIVVLTVSLGVALGTANHRQQSQRQTSTRQEAGTTDSGLTARSSPPPVAQSSSAAAPSQSADVREPIADQPTPRNVVRRPPPASQSNRLVSAADPIHVRRSAMMPPDLIWAHLDRYVDQCTAIIDAAAPALCAPVPMHICASRPLPSP